MVTDLFTINFDNKALLLEYTYADHQALHYFHSLYILRKFKQRMRFPAERHRKDGCSNDKGISPHRFA
jgi:hypothetical protein